MANGLCTSVVRVYWGTIYYCAQEPLTSHHRAPSQKFGRHHNGVMMMGPVFPQCKAGSVGSMADQRGAALKAAIILLNSPFGTLNWAIPYLNLP